VGGQPLIEWAGSTRRADSSRFFGGRNSSGGRPKPSRGNQRQLAQAGMFVVASGVVGLGIDP